MGAALQGGRWNTVSLAALEVLVQFSVLPRDFVLTEIHIPAVVIVEFVSEQDLPTDWRSLSPSPTTQEIGRRWAVELGTAVLSVPSAIVPIERNYVLNPRHPDFGQIEFLPSTPFRFDPRLK
jgi:RES domain-containing protein